MRLLLFLSFTLCLILGCKKDIEIVETKNDDGTLYEKYARRTIDFTKHGPYTQYYENGKVFIEANYSNDTLQGLRQMFHENGETQSVEQYQNGHIVGEYKGYYDNKQLEIVGNYTKGAMNGRWKRYYNTGELMEIVMFKDNEENGPFLEYYKNGNLKAEGNYINGDNEHGILKEFNEEGELIKKMQCDYGICRTFWTLEEGDIKNKNI